MRCKNCGWENPSEQTTCEKCHCSLKDATPTIKSNKPVTDRLNNDIAEGAIFNDYASYPAPGSCPKCGYPISDYSKSCPNCNYDFHEEDTIRQIVNCESCGADVVDDAKDCPNCGTPTTDSASYPHHIERQYIHTVISPTSELASTTESCTLKPIGLSEESSDNTPILYSGDKIILNRENTDANNNSISSIEQAILTYEDGEWYIENRSEQKTTFIRVNGKVRLTSGDIIVLGNREFEFKR